MKGKEYVFEFGGFYTRIRFEEAGIARITRNLRPFFPEEGTGAAVLKGGVPAAEKETDGAVCLRTEKLTVRVNKASGALSFFTPDDRLLLREPCRRPCVLAEKPKGENAAPGERALECRQNFVFGEDEALYGLGSHEEGRGNLRGGSRLLFQHNFKAVVPLMVSTRGWGILFDMGCLMAFHDDAEGSCLWADCTEALDWVFIYGDGTYRGLMKQVRALTGETPLLPRYALGYVQSKERYHDQKEILDTAAEYRRRGIPLDMIVLDWMSWPDGQWGLKKFDRERFPSPEKMSETLHDMNVRLMISVWPKMNGDRNSDRDEMREKGYLLPDGEVYDAFDPAARRLYWEQARDGLFRRGVDAWWCDCSEPFESDWPCAVKPELFERARLFTREAGRNMGSARVNLYSLNHARGMYEGQRSETDEKRVLNLTRSSWAGQHRYAACTWSGDVSAKWETLRRHIPEGLNFCAAGEAYWTADAGAFFPGSGKEWFIDGDFDGGCEDPGYRELYVRWLQYAAFLPMMRSHGTGTPREIWHYGEAGEPFYDAIAEAIRLRYRLVPYLYSLMARTNAEGLPMLLRPALLFPEDRALRDNDRLMMLGDFLLVSPVTRPMRYGPGGEELRGADTREEIYLPAGHVWHDLNTLETHLGGQTIKKDAPLNVIPAFVRGGAILPWGGNVQSTAETDDGNVEIVVFPGEDGAFTLYDDAGDGYGYERGEKCVIPFGWNDAEGVLTVGERRGSYPGMPEEIRLRVRLAGGEATEIPYRGEKTLLKLAER